MECGLLCVRLTAIATKVALQKNFAMSQDRKANANMQRQHQSINRDRSPWCILRC
jgi:hypothetical protein